MAWMIGTANGYKDCLSQMRDFCKKAYEAGAVTPGGGNTGNGTVLGACAGTSAVAETLTLTCTTGGGNGVGVFSVSGSVSGSLGNATVGQPFSHAKASFILSGGSVDFATSDSFTFAVSSSTAVWADERWDTDWAGDASNEYEWIANGIGAGSDEVFVGFRTRSDGATYWNIETSGLTGFVDHDIGKDKPLSLQPGYYPFYSCANGPGTNFTFLCVFTSRAIKLMITLEAYSGWQNGLYVGWILPYATPSQWSYPMYCGASTDDYNQTITPESDHSCFWKQNNGAILDISTWRRIIDMLPVAPLLSCESAKWYPGISDNLMRWYPLIVAHTGTNNIYGELEGVHYPTPFVPGGGLLTAGDLVFVSDAAAMAFKNVERSSAGELIAIELMGD